MNDARTPPKSDWDAAILAARIFAVDPCGTGICVRARPGPQRDEWLAVVRRLLNGAPCRKMPLGITDDRLLGGLDLSMTLVAGRPVAESGLLSETDGGALVIPSAERLAPGLAARIASVHDLGEVRLERDGLAQRLPARFGLILLDEGLPDEAQPSASLIDRTAMQVDLSQIRSGLNGETTAADDIAAARERLLHVTVSDDALMAICQASLELGIASIRASLLAVKVARIAAALDGRGALNESDLALAGQLVLAWRATALPRERGEDDAPEQQSDQDDASSDPPQDEQFQTPNPDELTEMVLEATRSALPPDLLAMLATRRAAAAKARTFGQSGVKQRSLARGRRIGVIAGDPRCGGRLDLVATLRAAAPWQRIRSRNMADLPRSAERAGVLQIRASDFRIVRFVRQTETLTIFAVDASGSLALNRMAEAKGAVESLLAECYVRRDQVAMLVFGGKKSDLALPPTRSLVRAKRSLSGLPAGGGTPLASGIDAALGLAQAARGKGQTPLIVLLTDGRANIARDGRAGRQTARDDAIASARILRASGVKTLLIDTSPRPDPRAEELAGCMGAIYLALPYLNSGALSSAVKQARIP